MIVLIICVFIVKYRILFLKMYFLVFYLFTLCGCMWQNMTHMPWHTCRSQRTTCRIQFFPFTVWVPVTEYRSSGMFSIWIISMAPHLPFCIKHFRVLKGLWEQQFYISCPILTFFLETRGSCSSCLKVNSAPRWLLQQERLKDLLDQLAGATFRDCVALTGLRTSQGKVYTFLLESLQTAHL